MPLTFTPRIDGNTDIDGLVISNSSSDVDQIACSPFTGTVLVRPAMDITARVRPAENLGEYAVLIEVCRVLLSYRFTTTTNGIRHVTFPADRYSLTA